MCRLFGLTGAPHQVSATFWLVEAPDSLSEQSHREPDGTGLGCFDDHGRPVISKQPLAAYADKEFAHEARQLHAQTFVAHIRYASTGANSAQNTHPFAQDGLLFAHNGVIGGLDKLEAKLGSEMSLVKGDTDSERFFALISQFRSQGHDVAGAIGAAAGWIAANLPVYALNCIVISATELWALRYPDTHDLYVLDREAGGDDGSSPLEHQGAVHEIRVSSQQLGDQPSVVVASEPMDTDQGWRPMASGDLLHVDAQGEIELTRVLGEPPVHPLSLADLGPSAAASQKPSGKQS